jgi:hypothetical protein
MDKLRYGSDMKLPSDAPPTFYDIDLSTDYTRVPAKDLTPIELINRKPRNYLVDHIWTPQDAEPFKTERLW